MKTKIGCLVATALLAGVNTQPVSAQVVYLLEPDTKGNQIELTVANESPTSPLDSVIVHLETTRPWLNFASTVQGIPFIEANREATVTFTFAFNRSAPVSKKDTLEFNVRDKNGSTWTKSIIVQYAGPTTFALDQNFPPTRSIPPQRFSTNFRLTVE